MHELNWRIWGIFLSHCVHQLLLIVHVCADPSAIQRKGCLVIRLLSSAEHLTSQSLCVSLAGAVMGALSQWRLEPEVEVEVS